MNFSKVSHIFLVFRLFVEARDVSYYTGMHTTYHNI